MKERHTQVLALLPYPEEGASVRFRVTQFLPALAAAGFDVEQHSFMDSSMFRLMYEDGHLVQKGLRSLSRTISRVQSLSGDYDMALIHRDALPFGPAMIERWLGRRVPVVYDFDDAIYRENTSAANRRFGFLKMPGKVEHIIRAAAEVIAGNEYLAAYARRFSSHVNIIPTVVDTHVWKPSVESRDGRPLVIGWIGTPTTRDYLMTMQDVFTALAKEHDFVVRLSGSKPVTMPGVKIENVPWRLDREVDLFSTCDIGVYPLPLDEWTLGKCGFKAIQFMACGVPTVASPVGVNKDIIQDGISGFLANEEREWRDRLKLLLTDAEARRRIGMAGRARIEEAYSLRVHAPAVVSVFEKAARSVHAHA